MQIKEAIIGQFGKLQNRQISFEPGINVIYGEMRREKRHCMIFCLQCFLEWKKGVEEIH